MKFTLLFASAFAQTALEIVAGSSVHKTLASLASGLPEIVDVLKSSGPFTLFAPTDAAFNALDAATLEAVQKDATLLANVLKYHVIPGTAFDPAGAPAKSFPVTALSKPVGVSVKDGQVELSFGLSTAKVTSSVKASNGIVHIVDHVLVPPPSASKIAAAANLTELIAALQKVNLVDTVDQAKDITIFAPTNEAFANLATFAAANNLEITNSLLEEVLKLHVIPGVVTSVDISKQPSTTAKALSGKDVSIMVEGGKVMVKGDGNAKAGAVVVADVLYENGIIHVIDTVLLPNLSGPGATTVSSASSTKNTIIGALALVLLSQLF